MKNMLLAFIIVIIILFSPAINYAQPPNLGTAANFVLFTSTGAVNNTGISQLTGNVGTNNGSSTGFGNVNGGMHDGDGVSTQAAADLLLAYNQLNSAIPTFTPAPALGNGDTLVAGVYGINAVTTLNGTLYLDAKGSANAVFIFQIGAAFSTGVNAKIKLINSALACNVFWKVEGLVSMASGNYFTGTIVANNAAITLNTNDTLEGRALSTAGAVSVSGVLAYTPIGCGSALLTGPVAPDLKSAACFAIFSANGTVTNSGISHVTGDIGSNAGLTTGYNPLFVTGFIHPIPDTYTAACAADLLNAYTYVNTLPNDIELLYPAQFGQNLVLTPHTYIMNAAATLTDSLYLNAEGDFNAVFVIKVKGAFSTSTFAKVLLINGTQAKNVYWVVDGAVSISDNSVFNGTIICNNGAISLNTGVTLNGQALTTGGALATAAIIATSPFGNCNLLPVSWLYFRGKPLQQSVLLEWATATEINEDFFTIEKSKDGVTFETLGKVNATGGIGMPQQNYSFTDGKPYNLNYYRISQTDKDGQRNYYTTIVVKANVNNALNVLQYVQYSYMYIQISGAVPGNGSIELYTIEGQKMISQKVILTAEASTYKIDKALPRGIYLLNISGQNQKLYSTKVIVP